LLKNGVYIFRLRFDGLSVKVRGNKEEPTRQIIDRSWRLGGLMMIW